MVFGRLPSFGKKGIDNLEIDFGGLGSLDNLIADNHAGGSLDVKLGAFGFVGVDLFLIFFLIFQTQLDNFTDVYSRNGLGQLDKVLLAAPAAVVDILFLKYGLVPFLIVCR